MTNQHAGASVLKGGLLQCYQLQAWVYGARTGTGTGPCAGRLGTPLGSPRLSPSFVTGVFVWLPPQGGWRHTWGSRPLPGAHISIRRSLGSVATSRSPPPGGGALPEGVGGSDGIRRLFSGVEAASLSYSPFRSGAGGVLHAVCLAASLEGTIPAVPWAEFCPAGPGT